MTAPKEIHRGNTFYGIVRGTGYGNPKNRNKRERSKFLPPKPVPFYKLELGLNQEVAPYQKTFGGHTSDIIQRFKSSSKEALMLPLHVKEFPDIFGVPEDMLLPILEEKFQFKEHRTLSLIRVAFWKEYDRCTKDNCRLSADSFLSGVCPIEFWEKTILLNAASIAYILCPPSNYMLRVEEILVRGMESMSELMDIPNIDPNGKPNAAVMALKLKLMDMLDKRLLGGPVQKNLHVHSGSRTKEFSAPTGNSADPMLAVQERLQQLAEKERESLNLPLEKKPEEKVVVVEQD